MESVNPANKNTQPNAAADPQVLQLSTPDPHEATKPVRVFQSLQANPSETTQPKPALKSELEDTKPILVRSAAAEPAPLPAPAPSEELPAWLITFAAQEAPATAPVNPEEDTRAIPVEHPGTPAEAELPLIRVPEPTAQAPAEDSGWTVESLPEQAATGIAAEELGNPSETETAQAEAEPPITPVPAQTPQTSPEDSGLTMESLPEQPAAGIAAEELGNPSETETVPSGESISEAPGSAEVSAEQPLPLAEEIAADDAPKYSLANSLDEGRYQEAGLMLQEMSADPTARADALRVLRSRLHLSAESQPLWQFYAELCSADDQPGLARQALETAEKLRNEPGE